MKRFTGLLSKRSSSSDNTAVDGEPPEVSVARGVRLFCESGGPNNAGEEVLHLPVIVEAAESSPAAAKEAANVIRKFLSKDNYQRAYLQYNAIMLVRILADNPGKTFTRNLDGKFVITTKELLREGRDMSVQQILRETLDTFQIEKSQEETLQPLITMWQNEKAKMAKKGGPAVVSPPAMTPALSQLIGRQPMPHPMNAPPFNPNQQQNYFARSHKPRGLPPPHELASRIEEAKTSAKLLLQVVQSTPPNEILGNELIKEFADRCQSASRSIQGYIGSDSPPPDEDTLLTLIETNDQLAMAMSKHQRAVLQARRITGQASPSPPGLPPRGATPQQNQNGIAPSTSPATGPVNGTQAGPFPPPGPPPSRMMEAQATPPPGPPPRLGMQRSPDSAENPFDDSNQAPPQPPRTNGTEASLPSLSQEGSQSSAYHPGYTATPSYVKRQEHSGNNLTMHGAAKEEEEDEDDGRRPTQYRF